jgi:hypothetical protein
MPSSEVAIGRWMNGDETLMRPLRMSRRNSERACLEFRVYAAFLPAVSL